MVVVLIILIAVVVLGGAAVVVATRLHGVMGERPTGTIASEVTRRPGPKALYCNSYNVAYVLHRPT